jgi:deoxyadenosine/deoxycytidine kinase
MGRVRRIAVVGPCGAGKTTLATALQNRGFEARQIAQEHSYVADMWEQFNKPDILIYLDASYQSSSERKNLNWLVKEYEEQLRRLRHARQHCDFYIHTDGQTTNEVLIQVLEDLNIGHNLSP